MTQKDTKRVNLENCQQSLTSISFVCLSVEFVNQADDNLIVKVKTTIDIYFSNCSLKVNSNLYVTLYNTCICSVIHSFGNICLESNHFVGEAGSVPGYFYILFLIFEPAFFSLLRCFLFVFSFVYVKKKGAKCISGLFFVVFIKPDYFQSHICA